MTHASTFDNAKGVVGIFIILLSFALFLIFYNNQDYLIESNQLYLFLTLATLAVAFMLTLFYLVSNSKHPVHKAHVHKTVKISSKSKKKKSSR